MKEIKLELLLIPDDDYFPSYDVHIEGEIKENNFFFNIDCILEERGKSTSFINSKNFILCEGYIEGKFDNGNISGKAYYTSGISWKFNGNIAAGQLNLKITNHVDNYTLKGTIQEELTLELLTHTTDLTNYKITKK